MPKEILVHILLALLNDDMINCKSKPITEVPRITQTLLIEPSFQMSTLYFLLGDSKVEDKQGRCNTSSLGMNATKNWINFPQLHLRLRNRSILSQRIAIDVHPKL